MERKRKIGRNDPCPCGSGKKYKKCCGAVEDLIHISKASDSIRFTKETAYIGTLGQKREAFCRHYTEHKQKLIELISKEQIKKAESLGKSVTCSKGCSFCCDEIIRSSLQEGEAIVYYLYHHENVLNSFVKAFPRWLAEARKHEDILMRMEQTQAKGFDRQISFEKMQSMIGEEAQAYWGLHIPCPFLSDNACSIYEVRPWVCANVFATKRCDLSSPNEDKIYWLDLPPTIELPFWDDRIEVVYSDIMPNMVYRILIGGFRFFSEIPGLTNILKEYLSDPEVEQFAEHFKSR